MKRAMAGLVVAGLLAAVHAAAIDPPNPDFDGDGSTDILFTGTSGYLTVWTMGGVVRQSSTAPDPDHPVDANWSVVCTADFNADGSTDLLWRNSSSGALVVWTLDGLDKLDGEFVKPLTGDTSMMADLDWRVVSCPDMGAKGRGGTPDATPDGSPDILWQKQSTRELKIWYMDELDETFSYNTSPSAPTDPGWYALAAREFGTSLADSDPDGHPDLLFQNSTSKKTVIWFMSGHARTSGEFTDPDGPVNTNWNVTGAGDFGTSSTNTALDGKADIVFRNVSSGSIVVWLMDGATRAEGVFTNPSAEADLSKVLIAPR